MDKRENLLRALRRESPDYVPWSLDLCESQLEVLAAKTGSRDAAEFFDLPFRTVELAPSVQMGSYDVYYPALPDNTWVDMWGVGHRKGSIAHFSQMLHPMERFTSPDAVRSFPLPDIMADYRWVGLEERIAGIKRRGLAAVYFAVQIFEPAWYLRGMENLMVDMVTDPDMADACLERVTGLQERLCARLAEAGVDMIVYGDDVGTQRSMMMAPQMWRQWLKPGMARVIRAAKAVNPQLLCYYHSDGNVADIIEELIEIGVDVLNPVQPECMDPVQIKALYGDRLSFWGTIGTQTTMPFGTAGDVREAVRAMISTVGRGGGLVIAPTHLVEPEVPWENILAFYDEVRSFGRYR